MTSSCGPLVQQRTRRLLAALLDFVEQNTFPETGKDTKLDSKAPKLNCSWVIEENSVPKLFVETGLKALEALTAQDGVSGKLSVDQVKESIKCLQSHLEIFEDLRGDKKQGSSAWRFTLKLWSQDKHKNLRQFDKEWERRKAQASKTLTSTITIPKEFQTLVDEKTQEFVGREYVFAAIQDFLNTHLNGYFILAADPGVGKSTILAKFVQDNECLAYFNIRAQGMNRASQFLESVCIQLCDRYSLPYQPLSPDAHCNGTLLTKLLTEASTRLQGDKKLVIAIDALDEVDLSSQDAGSNILYLPTYLPQNVYFVLTQRKITLPFVVQTPQQLFDLMSYSAESRQDVQEYIQRAAKRERLQAWLNQQQLTVEVFVEQLADKSENNFMYLRYVLPQIEAGFYQDLHIEQLPQGLQNYYEDHWLRMGMKAQPLPQAKIKIVYVLSEINQPVSRQLISEYTITSEMVVQEVLDEWEQFLNEQEIDSQICYSIYHTSFRDFLHRKEILQAAGIKIQEIKAMLTKRLWDVVGGYLEDD
jgi:hypothetical protein